MKKDIKRLLRLTIATLLAGALLAGCSGGNNNKDSIGKTLPDPLRAHDERQFVVVKHIPATEANEEYNLAFEPLPNAQAYYGKHNGIHGEAAYQIEVPVNWNGILVMYAHGYRGEGPALTVNPPRIREELIGNGYAWAASSYSANYYDVHSGVEDTNALALAFGDLTDQVHGTPSKYYIIGHSMGGHVAGAAIEAETLATATNRVEYSGAVPMCGVMGDTELFNYFAAYNIAAQQLAGITEEATAENYETEILPRIKEALWENYGSIVPLTGPVRSPEGERLLGILKNISGGQRPTFDPAFPLGVGASELTAWHDLLLSYGVPDGTINGILNKNVLDTTNVTYRWETSSPSELSSEEQTFNSNAVMRIPNPDANAQRRKGLRWIPKINGDFNVPVVTIHNLGDLFVPFSMEQIYARRARESGSSQWLVQRAIRTIGHCDFNIDEEWEAFQDMVNWEQDRSNPPVGDDVLTPDAVADPHYGCQFSRGAHRLGCSEL